MDYNVFSSSISTSNITSTSPQASTSKPTKQRASKACQHCQSRRKKCTANPPFPCDNCIKAGLGNECVVREKARPNRKLFAGARLSRHAPTMDDGMQEMATQITQLSPHGTTIEYLSRQETPFFRLVEMDLERMYKEKTGSPISLSLSDESTHPLLSTTLSRPPLPALSPTSELHLLLTFLSTLKRMLNFLSSPSLLSLHSRVRTQPHSVRPDELALFYCMLCLGRFREMTWDDERGCDIVPGEEDRRDDIVFFRWASESLKEAEGPSIVALQALCLLHLFVQATGTTTACRELIERAVVMAHELGLNRIQTALSYDLDDRVGQLYFYIVFVDLYHASLVGLPPLIKSTDYDSVVFDSFNRTLVKAVVIQSSLLSSIHSSPDTTTRSSDFVLRYEEMWGDWLNEAMEDSALANEIQDSLVIIHYHWDRIVLRTPCIYSRSLSVSSLAIVARSSSQILNSYSAIIKGGRFNLSWPQLRRIATTGYLVVECYWRRELMQREAEELLGIALEALGVLRNRWKAAGEVEMALRELMRVLDLSASTAGSTVTSPSQSVDAAPTPPSTSTNPSFFQSSPDPLTSFDHLGLDSTTMAQDWSLGPWMISSGMWGTDGYAENEETLLAQLRAGGDMAWTG